MARQFDGADDYLVSAAALAALAGKQRFAVGFWLNKTFLNNDAIIMESSANSNSNPGTFRVLANASGGVNKPAISINANDDGGNQVLLAAASPSNAADHHWLINFNLGNSGSGGVYEVETLYIDGSLVTLTVDSGLDHAGTLTSQVLYLMSRGGAALFGAGILADLCIWAPAVTPIGPTDAGILAGGARAGTVRPDDIVYYWPLAGEESPEPALLGSIPMNVSGTTPAADPAVLDPVPDLGPIPFTVERTSTTEATLTFGTPFGAPDGISVLRATGAHTVDGSGDAFGDPGYDPSTISGATTVATGVTSPYVDTGLDIATDYTYAIIRTGPDA